MQTSKKINSIARLGMLIAITLMLGLTILGYPKFGIIAMTIVSIPVVIGAMIQGPSAGAVLGFIFGLTSFFSAIGFGLGNADSFGAALLNINPTLTVLLCFVPRILMGWLSGLIFKGLMKIDKTKTISFIATSLSGSLLNTILFLSGLVLLFGNSYVYPAMQKTGSTSVIGFIIAAVGLNALIEAVTVTVIGTAVGKAIWSIDNRGKNVA